MEKKTIRNIRAEINFYMSKTKTTTKELSQGLLYALVKFSNHFYEDFGARAMVALEIKLDVAQLVTLKREVYMINMWIISKILSPDKKVLDEFHKAYLFTHADMAQTEQKKIDFPKIAEKELHERYARYYSEWDDSGSKSGILALTMLEYMFNKGQPDKRLINIDLFFRVNTHVFGMMKAMLDFRNGFEIVD